MTSASKPDPLHPKQPLPLGTRILLTAPWGPGEQMPEVINEPGTIVGYDHYPGGMSYFLIRLDRFGHDTKCYAIGHQGVKEMSAVERLGELADD